MHIIKLTNCYGGLPIHVVAAHVAAVVEVPPPRDEDGDALESVDGQTRLSVGCEVMLAGDGCESLPVAESAAEVVRRLRVIK